MDDGIRNPAATEAFRAARDHLLAHEGDLTGARQLPRPDLTRFGGPGRFNWALDWFDVLAAEEGSAERVALRVVDLDADGTLTSETALTFRRLADRSDRTANWLRARGVRRGDRVLLVLGNRVELWEALLGAIKLGAVVVPATTLLSADDLADRVARGRVAHIVAESELADRFAAVPASVTRIAVGEPRAGWLDFADAANAPSGFEPDGPTSQDDLLLMYFTSGTTALPSAVAHTHASGPVGHLSTMYWQGVRPGDVHLNISSPGWAKHAWSSLFAPWNAGATVLVVNQPRFAAGPVLDQMVRCGVTTFCAPPTVWRMLIQERLDRWRPVVREAIGAGEPLNPEVIEQVREAWGVTIRDGYGQTETTAQIGNAPGAPVKPGSMGRPLPGWTVLLIDPTTGKEVDGPGVDGEICLPAGADQIGLMAGYVRDADGPPVPSTAEDGLHHTRDIASRDADGYFTYVGRTDDVFKSSDYRISPFELESVLLEHPAVAEAAVVPAPDPVRLAVPKAYVTRTAGAAADRETARSILAHVRDRVAPYRRVRRLEFVDELPKTVSGKIRRVQLRAQTPAASEFTEDQLFGGARE
ncbi:AMP-dependent synthetase [Mangrovactinospora gilvigrisea]|uniref:AMP-dependent synthetase n=1 Tax=Mangrovactinospora gilvigrisea TaxID=1428644 RepID=A0A1J7C3S8_9ACTN|nr:AMP-binding protein [Mangrovactinospora gilvigrisea]OIV36208.1 AMP-dependent synthetase [Mangrovactinospora gilvigrisea]